MLHTAVQRDLTKVPSHKWTDRRTKKNTNADKPEYPVLPVIFGLFWPVKSFHNTWIYLPPVVAVLVKSVQHKIRFLSWLFYKTYRFAVFTMQC